MPEAEGMINVYTCQACGGQITTRNRDEGTTPFMLRCRISMKCPGDMYSAIYRCSQTATPDHEWYRPKTTNERRKINSDAVRDHIAQGGLLLRKL